MNRFLQCSFRPKLEHLTERILPAISSVTGNIAVAPLPADVRDGQSPTGSIAIVSDELQNVVLTSPLKVDVWYPQPGWQGVGADAVPVIGPSDPYPQTGYIAAGTTVSSVVIHWDPSSTAPGQLVNGTIHYTGVRLVGLITESATLDASDHILGLPTTTYPTGEANRGQEIITFANPSDNKDALGVLSDESFFIYQKAGLAQDQMRAIFVSINTPPSIDDQFFTVDEGITAGALVGQVNASDSNPGDTLTYAITGGNTAGAFTISSSTGQITVANAEVVNFETAQSFPLTVRVTDSEGLSDTATVTVSVNNLPPSIPVDVDQTPNSISEGAVIGALVGVKASSEDVKGPNVTYRLVNDADGRFGVYANTGEVFVADNRLLDGDSTHNITVEASDGAGGISIADFTISIANEAPVISNLKTNATLNNPSTNRKVHIQGTVTDPGPVDTHTVKIEWGDGKEEIVAVNQENGAFDANHHYSSGGLFTVRVTADDNGGFSATRTITAVVSGIRVHEGVLEIVGTDRSDKVTVRHKPNDADMLQAIIKSKGHRRIIEDMEADSVNSIHVLGLGGRDKIKIGRSIDLPTVLDGGDSKDTLWGGSGPDVLLGGYGNDVLRGRAGMDIVIGGFGKDKLFGGRNDDIVIGGEATNHSRDFWMDVLENQQDGNSEAVTSQLAEIIVDDYKPDWLYGNRGKDLFFASTLDVLRDYKVNKDELVIV